MLIDYWPEKTKKNKLTNTWLLTHVGLFTKKKKKQLFTLSAFICFLCIYVLLEEAKLDVQGLDVDTDTTGSGTTILLHIYPPTLVRL